MSDFERWQSDPEGFWAEQAARLAWYERPSTTLQRHEDGSWTWFPDGALNTCYLALDYHIEQGRGDQLALIYDSPVTETKRSWTFSQLRDEVARLAGTLQSLGVTKGDRVIIYMPMVPEAAMAMLACARLGAIHSVVFGGFAPPELATRIDDATPRVLLTASCGIEGAKVIPYMPLVRAALGHAEHQPDHVVVLERDQVPVTLGERELDWRTLVQRAEPAAPVPVAGGDTLYVLYTSGTTGRPKGVVRDHGGHATALRYSLEYIYGVEPGEVFWAASDVGWVVGHSYIVYAPLLTGCTTILYEGKPVKTPDASAFWRVIEEHKVNVFFTAPTAFRAIRKEDPEAKGLAGRDLSALRSIFVAGERLDPPTLAWLEERTGKPILDHWWQTETGWPMVAYGRKLGAPPVKAGSAGKSVPGYEVVTLHEDGSECKAGETGDIAVRLPLAPGAFSTLWNDHERFLDSYLSRYSGYYLTSDGGYIDEDGYVFILGRIDDVINVAGHRLSTGEMEAVVAKHPAVAECAVVGIDDELRGQVPIGFLVLADGFRLDPTELENELVAAVRKEIGPIAVFKRTVVVGRLPKTRSGKILRRTLRKLATDVEVPMPATIDDPVILAEVTAALRARGVGRFGPA
ncbi:AMP-binding protein [Pseudenhygromyxa sp. WMMC2535]|uniref:AMP-binding protein n=1 Tax=Pseudenhygromyxa sp. WMMC2535 TaxID=2712867 RepID=UPI0015519AD3|nr:AMP-binding protein [Pseudenhygromyxa sp. WMMC2535]NVB42767.1 AMP-binding protein [Pseudenhygromyxa sp. WMMC2535]